MQSHSTDYFAAYRSLKLTRDARGVLVAELRSNGGPFTFTAHDHTEFVDAFFGVGESNLLEARMIITAYNQHVRLLSSEPFVVCASKVHSADGADIVMESFHH